MREPLVVRVDDGTWLGSLVILLMGALAIILGTLEVSIRALFSSAAAYFRGLCV